MYISNKEKEILELIENSIKSGNAGIKSFLINLLTKLNQQISIENIKVMIEKKLIKKNIYFIRHAEAVHNELEKKYKGDFSKCNVYDPELTLKGIKQTKFTIEKLKKNKINFDIIYISPLTRAIQTYFLIKNQLNDDAKIIITDFIKEVISFCDKNKGKKLTELKKNYKGAKFNFDYMTKEFWWFNLGKNKKNEFEGLNRFILRLYIFILWIIFREENNILIISHSHVFKNLQDIGIFNADMVKMDNKILFKKILFLLNFDIKSLPDDD